MNQIDEMIASLRRLATLPEDVAKLAAPLIEAELKASAAAGQAPDGKQWEPTKEGRRALPNAADAITVTAVGSVVQAKIPAPYSYHQLGGVKPKRLLIPEYGADIPPRLVKALEQAVDLAMKKAIG